MDSSIGRNMAKINKDKINVLKKFAKDPVAYVSKKAKCVKAAKSRGLSSKEASAFCRAGSQSSERKKAASKIKGIEKGFKLRRSKGSAPKGIDKSYPEKEVLRQIKMRKK